MHRLTLCGGISLIRQIGFLNIHCIESQFEKFNVVSVSIYTDYVVAILNVVN